MLRRGRLVPASGHPARLLLALAAAAACLGTTFMSHAPNRLADGLAQPLWAAPALPAACVAASLAGSLLLAGMPASRVGDRLALLCALALAGALLLAAGLFARALVEPGHPAQRQTLGPAFWIAVGCASLLTLDALQALMWPVAARAALLAGLVAGFVSLATMGVFRDLSLTREFIAQRSAFGRELTRHVGLVAASVALAVLACLPLIGLVRRRPGIRAGVFAALGLLQTIPSIALFGLLLAPLESLAARVPVLRALGVSGLGVTPVIIALVLYAAFPLVRMGDAAFAAVPAPVGDAAAGLGFGRRARYLRVDLPLAAPVLLAAIRVVTLQSIGLATVAALIGGGGLGTFIFAGIGQYALDLVLVGALPVVVLALAADLAFRWALAVIRVPD